MPRNGRGWKELENKYQNKKPITLPDHDLEDHIKKKMWYDC